MNKTALASCLDRNLQQFPPEYRGQLSSHLPMALQALHSLGADDARLLAFFDSYGRRFDGLVVPQPVAAPGDWLPLRGEGAAFEALRSYFERALAEQGRDAVLSRILPDLMPGVAAVAFHGLIRVAHALQAEHQAELAAALAYWACRWQHLPAAAQPSPTQRLSLAAWSERLVSAAPAWHSEAPSIFLRMLDASATPLYAELAGAALPAASSLRARVAELAGLALDYYLHSRNFTVLHMITGLRALRVVLPWLPDEPQFQNQAQAVLGQAFVAAYMAGRVQRRALPLATTGMNWPALAAAATRSDDDHVIKLVHASREEWAAYGDPRYLQAAALALS